MGFYSIVNQFHQQGQLEVVLVDEILSYVPAFDIFQVRQFNIHSLSYFTLPILYFTTLGDRSFYMAAPKL